MLSMATMPARRAARKKSPLRWDHSWRELTTLMLAMSTGLPSPCRRAASVESLMRLSIELAWYLMRSMVKGMGADSLANDGLTSAKVDRRVRKGKNQQLPILYFENLKLIYNVEIW